MPEIEALAEAEAQRWNREGRLAAWFLAWLPAFLSHSVAMGINVCFGDKAELPDLPKWEDLVNSIPDYMKDSDG